MTRRLAVVFTTVILVAAGGVLMLLALGRSPTGSERQLMVAGLLVIMAAVLISNPLRLRLAAWLDRLHGGDQRDPREILDAAGGRLAQPLPLEDLLAEVAQSLRAVLPLTAAELWTYKDSRLTLATSDPYRDPREIELAPAEVQALMAAQLTGLAWLRVWLPQLLAGRPDERVRAAVMRQPQAVLGVIVLELLDGVEELSVDQEQAVIELSRQLGLRLQNSHLDDALRASVDDLRLQADELRQSRARVVAAGDAERRRIERDLHDGAQQHLVAISVNLKLARELGATEPERATALLARLGEEAELAMRELRGLAHGIYPPLLQQRGLDEALHVAADRTRLDVSVTTQGTARYPEDVEAAIYFCCVEALQNAAKHAGADARVSICVEQAAAQLEFSVTDNGAGFERGSVTGGAGLVGMGDRLAALGGTLEVDSQIGHGTRIHGTIPLEQSPAGQPP